jgi:pentatricopeptide repeat domain-containing protein 1
VWCSQVLDGYLLVKEMNKDTYVLTFLVKAVILLKEMHFKNMSPNTITYNFLIDGLRKLGKIYDVWDLIDQMYNRGHTSLLDALCINQQVDKVIALLTKIKGQRIQPDMYV